MLTFADPDKTTLSLYEYLMASRPHLSTDLSPMLRWIIAPELRSNVAGLDTETSVQRGWSKQTNDPDTGEWRAMLETEIIIRDNCMRQTSW